ncbi:hypothetical protein EV421DRAFT_1744267 [Armillaria borealis]|uniref:Uncharacterized protein n=1 Tax=Armillaria borealis TaxID=47425 RepID=A0AA39ITM5_9AGAR|nr:hypothetical protein EV421DRAFT_1744267 [Armillaria borealis]
MPAPHGPKVRNPPLPSPITLTHSKSLPPPGSSNAISSGSHLAPPPPYSEVIERGVNETSPLYPGTQFRGNHRVEQSLNTRSLSAYQSTPASSSCTRQYSALLRGIPNDKDCVQCCKEKNIIIHGLDRHIGTTRVHGHWIVESNERRCMMTWGNFRHKGCAANGSHYRPPWDNWREMCSTTPADYGWHHFDRPYGCYWISNFVLHDSELFGGVTGVWFLKDDIC